MPLSSLMGGPATGSVAAYLSISSGDPQTMAREVRERPGYPVIQAKLGIDVGQTTDDGKFTLVELECIGSCGTAPVALVDEDLHENLTPDRLCSLIDQVKDGSYTKGGSGAVKEDL